MEGTRGGLDTHSTRLDYFQLAISGILAYICILFFILY